MCCPGGIMTALPAPVETDYTDPAETANDQLWRWKDGKPCVSVKWTNRTHVTTAYIDTAQRLCSLVFTNAVTGQVSQCSMSYQKDGSCLVVYPTPIAAEMHQALAQMRLEVTWPEEASRGPCPKKPGDPTWPTPNQPVLEIGNHITMRRPARAAKKPVAPAAARLV